MSAPDVDDDDAVHGVDRLPGDAENAARAMDEIVADSDEDGGDTDEDVPDQPEDCLLYTSPSPRDQRGSRMPSSA